MAEESKIPNWEVPDEQTRFPEGYYLCALGKVFPIYKKDDPSIIEAVGNDVWIIQYEGTSLNPVKEIRITFKDGKLSMGAHGVRIVERYPNPNIMPTLAWRMRAFFNKFDVMNEVKSGDKTVKEIDWSKVGQKYGVVFRVAVVYQRGKNTKMYRNFDYETIEVLDQHVSVDQMKAIEERYASLKAQEDAAKNPSAQPPESASDLPF